MSFQLYKEGQGTLARGLLAFILIGTGIFAAVRLTAYMEGEDMLSGGLTIPLIGWDIGWRQLLAMGLVVPFGLLGIHLYNRPKLADFMIDTEGELRNKVTWPTAKEARNNSIVVVVTCILLGMWIVFADIVFKRLKELIY